MLVNEPVRLLQAVQPDTCAAATVKRKLCSSKLKGEAITTRLDKRLFEAPELPKVILLSSWARGHQSEKSAGSAALCNGSRTFVTGGENALRLILRELVLEKLDVLLHRSRGAGPPQLPRRSDVNTADAKGLCGEHHIAACDKRDVQLRRTQNRRKRGERAFVRHVEVPVRRVRPTCGRVFLKPQGVSARAGVALQACAPDTASCPWCTRA